MEFVVDNITVIIIIIVIMLKKHCTSWLKSPVLLWSNID